MKKNNLKYTKPPTKEEEIAARNKKILELVATIMVTIILWQFGTVKLNNPSRKLYPVRGVDVSRHQGTIDWEVLSQQGIDFAFIKATEGSEYVDEQFSINWENAGKTHLKIGAYHFFSYDSSGKTQAQNFIETVPILQNGLPPVVDIEFYGDNRKNPVSKAATDEILRELLQLLEEHYKKKPIIYATSKSFKRYIKNDYLEYPIWIRDVFRVPWLNDNRWWTFWQYSDKEKLEGYTGKENFIDMNIFRGTLEELELYINGQI